MKKIFFSILLIYQFYFLSAQVNVQLYPVSMMLPVQGEEYPKFKWGFMDSDGKLIIDYLFEEVSDFINGFAIVSRNEMSYNLVDSRGDLLLKEWANEIQPFNPDYAIIEYDNRPSFDGSKIEIINKKGEIVGQGIFQNPKIYSSWILSYDKIFDFNVQYFLMYFI